MARTLGAGGNRRTFSLKLKGAEGLAQALRDLGNDRTVKRILKKALLEEAEPAAQMARRLAAKDTRLMAEKINVSTTLSKRQAAQRRSPIGKKDTGVEVFLGAGARGPAHLIEFGTAGRRQKKTGRYTGYVVARPFMRPAWEAWKYKILDRFAFRLWAEIEKAAKRLAKRQARTLK